MEFLIIGIIVAVIAILLPSLNNKRKILKNNVYEYIAKEMPMTKTEAEFFIKLNKVVDERYFVFPQLHLSSILKPNANSKDYIYSFRHINSKSVDYVLCDRETLKPVYAIELDDYTHAKPDRIKRDKEVERIFSEADLPLVRLKDKNISESDIIQALIDAKEGV